MTLPRELFSNLLSLHQYRVPEEDFFTEVVAWLFSVCPDLLYSWMKECMEIDHPYTQSFIQTQTKFEALKGHEKGSKPDFVITLCKNGDQDVMTIESKIGSPEGKDQLVRYAGQLSKLKHARKRYLVYITRDYEFKDQKKIAEAGMGIEFKQLRWHQFYTFLAKQPKNIILAEVMKFMEEKEMTQITQISQSALIAFKHIPTVFEFFGSVLSEDIRTEYTKIFGEPGNPSDDLEYRRYTLSAWTNDWNFQLGFWMPGENDGEFPYLGATFEINADANFRTWQALAQRFKKIESETAASPFAWEGENLNEPNTWAHVPLWLPFDEILKEENHATSTRNHLFAFLNEARRVKRAYLRAI